MIQYYKGDTILKVENVALELKGKPILKDVSFEIKDILRVDALGHGRERDANNNTISGSKIKHSFDLCERGLAKGHQTQS